MGSLTTYVLDTAHGTPGTGMAVTLYRRAGDRYEMIKSATTNADGHAELGRKRYHRRRAVDRWWASALTACLGLKVRLTKVPQA